MSEPTSDPATDGQTAPETARPRRRRWRVLRFLASSVFTLLVLAVGAAALVVWALHSTRGSAWLLTLAPRIAVTGAQGSLLGDFSAERVDITLSGTSGVLRLDAPRWQALAATRGSDGRWLHLTIATLHANRVTLLRGASATPKTSEPATPPSTLRLPVEIEIGAASVDELRFGAAADAPTVRSLHARIHLGDAGGALHRFEALAASYDRASATGMATIAADAPFTVAAKLAFASADSQPPWQAEASATGPLAGLSVQATARVSPTDKRPPQSLDAHALVKPFAAWPLGELQASTRALDLSAFATALPATALSGQATLASSGLDQPAVVSIDLSNARAGRWNEGLLPVRQLRGELRARPDDRSVLEVQTLFAELGSARLDGGRVTATGRWTADRWTVDATLDKVRPDALDARAPGTALAGKASLVGTGFASAQPDAGRVAIVADVSGELADARLPRSAPRQARLRLDGSAGQRLIELRSAEATLGSAKASLNGRLTRDSERSPWRATGLAKLADFDPAPWWPGATGSLFSRGSNRLNANGTFDLVLPTVRSADALVLLAAVRGKAALSVTDSALAGVPLQGEASFTNSDGTAQPAFDVLAAGNRFRAQGRIGAAADHDSWQATIEAPELARLSALVRAPDRAASIPALGGGLVATARIDGRWPAITSSGDMHAETLRYEGYGARHAEGRWQLGTAATAPLDATLALDDVSLGGRHVDAVRARVTGTAQAHRAQLRVSSAALPPDWADALAAGAAAPVPAPSPPAAPSSAASAASAAPAAVDAAAGPRSVVVLDLEGGLVEANGERAAGWRGTVHELLAQGTAAPLRTWLQARELRGEVRWSGGPMRASLEPGTAQVLGATLRWSRFAWQGSDAAGAGARLDMQANIDPVPIARMLAALEPDIGWGGDLAVGAHVDVHGTPSASAEVVVQRAGGDLTIADEQGLQKLGVSELRLSLVGGEGLWTLDAAAAGSATGSATGKVTAHGQRNAAWPDASAPIDGDVALRIADLGAWGRWLPAGWRLGGEVHADAKIGGRVGAPEYTGHLAATNLGVRNFVQGVNITEGNAAIALQGGTAQIEHFTAKGGSGSLALTGGATFDAAPAAHLELTAERFVLLGRVDRRLVASGKAALRLDAKSLALDGEFAVDEGLIDFTRSDAPTLGDDVVVVNRPVVATTAATARAAAAPASPTTTSRQVSLDLRMAMGQKLRVRGRGLDAGLRGDLHMTSAAGALAVNGSLRAVDGSYQAYGQKLSIDRGVLAFVGPINNPRLDIEATRPNLDVRVGVAVSGTALNPRVRLFSEPDMSDIDKLSWLLLGRASEGAGANDTALLQAAALALLSGEGPGVADKLTHAIGFDTISVRQQSEGDVKETIVSLGKQISQRWYLGYERGLNATTGSWQLIYRLGRRLTVRAQAGGENSLDLIWTLRWN